MRRPPHPVKCVMMINHAHCGKTGGQAPGPKGIHVIAVNDTSVRSRFPFKDTAPVAYPRYVGRQIVASRRRLA
ncbi:MAG: hypothetical protein IPO30_17030 [Hyphomonadaceae bacterium]|nr:hypothetical protein [Hyphomonadaceae bacterium]